MLGLKMLDVAIGVIFVFLLLSLLCSALNEFIEGFLKLRAVDLEQGIRELLNDPNGNDLAEKVYNHHLIYSLFRGRYKPPGGLNPPAKPNPTLQFRNAVEKMTNSEVKSALLTIIDAAGDDAIKAREGIENWYNSLMDRVSGWYKRRVQQIVFSMGFVVAIALNVDTLAVFRNLANDRPLRSAIVTAAQTFKDPKTDSLLPAKKVEANINSLLQLGLPVGWSWRSELNKNNHAVSNPNAIPLRSDAFGWILKVIGWLLTGLAVSLGAPFWFDVLNKIMVVRSTVKPTEKSPDEGSEDKRK